MQRKREKGERMIMKEFLHKPQKVKKKNECFLCRTHRRKIYDFTSAHTDMHTTMNMYTHTHTYSNTYTHTHTCVRTHPQSCKYTHVHT